MMTEGDFINSFSEAINRNYEKLLPYMQDEICWKELYYVKSEIIDCLLIESNQAAITLTNHFLEMILKWGLVYNETNGKVENSINGIYDYSNEIEKFRAKTLSEKINACKGKGLLGKERSNLLQNQIRVQYRNGFSHSWDENIFGEKTMTAKTINPETGEIIEQNIAIKNLPVMQGIAQKNFADKNAFDYFKLVYETLKNIEGKVEKYE